MFCSQSLNEMDKVQIAQNNKFVESGLETEFQWVGQRSQ